MGYSWYVGKSLKDDMNDFANYQYDTARHMAEVQRQEALTKNTEKMRNATAALMQADIALRTATPENRPAAQLRYNQAVADKQAALDEAKTLSDSKQYFKQYYEQNYGKNNVNGASKGTTTSTQSGKTRQSTQSTQSTPSNSNKDNTASEQDKKTEQNSTADNIMESAFDATVTTAAGLAGAKAAANQQDPANTKQHLNKQAHMHEKEAGQTQQYEQQAAQMGNRDIYAQASQKANAKLDAANKSKLVNRGPISAANAGLDRDTVPDMDFNREEDTKMKQQERAQQLNEKKNSLKQVAEQERAAGDAAQNNYIEHVNYNNQSDALSQGGNEPDEQQPSNNAENTEENPQQEEQPSDTLPTGNAQHVIDALLGSSKGADLRNGTATQDKELYDYILSQGVKPITPKSQDFRKWESEFVAANGENGKRVMQLLRQGRAGSGDAANNYVQDKNGNYVAEGSGEKMNDTMKLDKNVIDGVTQNYQ